MDESTILLPPKEPSTCMYCGGPVETGGAGEHIVQRAIGGTRTLKDRVCTTCNNGVLSEVDKELCSRSFLSIVASQEIDAHLWQVWDVDHTSKNLLVEAKPEWDDDYALKHLVAYPQITFERHRADVRGDVEEMETFGRENFDCVLKKAARSAFQRYTAGKRDSITCEECQSSVVKGGYRLAPRLYAHRTIHQIAKKIDKEKFYLRYITDEDKNFALDALSKLHRQPRSEKFTQYKGSHMPTISFFFDVGTTVRGLLKMGLNLVAAVCENTPINPATFPRAIGLIRGAQLVSQQLVESCGFIQHGNTVTSIAAPNKAHSFVITHAAGMWRVYSSFFGGRIGAYVCFPGPHRESWATMKVITPLKSKDWTFTPSQLAQIMSAKVEPRRSSLICPSLRIDNTVSELQVTVETRKVRERKR